MKKTNNEAAEEFDNATFHSDFENEYFGDIDEENVIRDSENENGKDFEEEEMIEEDLCEEQIVFDNKTHSFGYGGESEFTSLALVDRGTSFMSDTLHTIYHGAFKKLLQLWTESSNKQPWSIARFLPLINHDLQNIRYRSTTTRAPRRYLSASIHGTKRPGSELLTNLQLSQQSYFASKNHCSSSNLSTFIE
ncbi:unnamed protein product [Rotaria sp. Silwood1]|nr:unnamed protein product [Rotaria sp. Silwood1]CAF3581684.1 unnamed protein product [Rotaria sp. Silwood1]CAF4640570.1 unnamed protein product [Rotaria sp. Silwood1]